MSRAPRHAQQRDRARHGFDVGKRGAHHGDVLEGSQDALRDGLSISEIARRTTLSRNTIKQWLRTPVRSEMRYRRSIAPKRIGPFETILRAALEADARRQCR